MLLPQTNIKLHPDRNTLKVELYNDTPETEYYRQLDSDEILSLLSKYRYNYESHILQAITLCVSGIMIFDVDFLPF